MANRQVLKGGSPRSSSMKRFKVNKNMTFKQFSKLDSDGDGVRNDKDCKPFNKAEQGKLHDLIKKVNKKIKEIRREHKKVKSLEKRIDKEEDQQKSFKLNQERLKKLKKIRELDGERKEKLERVRKLAPAVGAGIGLIGGFLTVTSAPVVPVAVATAGVSALAQTGVGFVGGKGVAVIARLRLKQIKKRQKEIKVLERKVKHQRGDVPKHRMKISKLKKELKQIKK